ncbi:succinate dehydrogenase [Methanoculleus taiwanensis]|uniref:Succinate dehydrogenase n=1 Tax=Methanoculleus taiwanensis TaxID=1550565 RepID=A0A498H3W2_9EURY|nr:fumarate reductase (CoM/CoB) subunit TfrB [Methanoculleus taiwanensis]RXE56905.1 succinate dehydrogenase [Methanoculleus taiwanensis]
MKTITVRVARFDPAVDKEPYFETYTVQVNEGARVLHTLHAIRDEQDPTLSYRYCCGSGQCGSCAVRVDGTPVLACMEEARDGITIEPLALPVQKDLVVDMEPVLKRIAWIEPGEDVVVPKKEEIEAIKPLRDCIECLSCVSACPALQVTAFAGPTILRQQMRLTLDPRDTHDRIDEAIEQGLFYCTTCKRCVEVCPKDIEIPGKAIEKLREIANRRGLTLPRHQEVAKMVKETGRSVGRTQPTFLEQVPEVIEPDGEVRGEVGFFVGCMFNGRVPQTALDAMEVMKRNGIRVIVPHDQVCCGSPLIRTGQTSFLDDLKQKNIDAFARRGITTVMTICAGCGATLKNDYETPFVVKDISEVLTEYGIEPPAKLDITATYHDPCHLLRGQGISEEPRELLRQVVREFVEMPTQCCGAGGGVRSGIPEEAAALGAKRDEEVRKTGADIVTTICPFCEFHIADCTDVPVKNLATLLLEGYRKKDAEREDVGKA